MDILWYIPRGGVRVLKIVFSFGRKRNKGKTLFSSKGRNNQQSFLLFSSKGRNNETP
jgi:hypothetical protein